MKQFLLKGIDMQISPQISLRNIDESESLTQDVLKNVERLEKFFPKITACQVLIEMSNHRHNKGNQFHVRIDVTVPGKVIVINRDPGEATAHEDAYVAVRDAFNAATRQLEDYARLRRGQVKLHRVQNKEATSQPALTAKTSPSIF